jgi:hypothetical protein
VYTHSVVGFARVPAWHCSSPIRFLNVGAPYGRPLSVFRRSDEEIRREITEDVIADGFFTDPARFTVTVHNGIVTLGVEPGSAVLGTGVAARVGHLEGVVAVRNRFVYPARSAPSFPSDPRL